MTTLFISDLHLQAVQPPLQNELLRGCLRFLVTEAPGADALYILGDLFEAWVGDDDDEPWLGEFSTALRMLGGTGTALYFMHGNRDFLLGEQFAARCGMQLLSESAVIDLYGRRALLLHGDTLCTEDRDYLKFRAQVRDPQWQQTMLARSLEERRFLAAMLRQQSKMAGSNKAEDIMDVTSAEVVRTMQENHVDLLIHGHTHRPARHALSIDGRPAERIVLGDWRSDGMQYLRAQRDGRLDLIHFPL